MKSSGSWPTQSPCPHGRRRSRRLCALTGRTWIVTTARGEFRLRVRTEQVLRTVDFLAPGAAEIGAFSRVVPDGKRCAYVFTQFFGRDMSSAEIDTRKATLAEELQAVRLLCEPA